MKGPHWQERVRHEPVDPDVTGGAILWLVISLMIGVPLAMIVLLLVL